MSEKYSVSLSSKDNEAKEKFDFTQTEWETFTRIENKQKEFHEWLKKRKLPSVETKAITCQTFEESAKFWSDMSQDSQSDFQKRHKKGWRLWIQKYQSFSKGAASFMEDLKPLLDVVQAAGVPYTGLAVTTVTALLTFSGRKSDMEIQISSAIEGIKDRLPGFKMYQAIYADNTELELDLRKKILFAYLAFIEMSMKIIKYYLQAGYRRWGTALFHSHKFKNQTDNVYSLFSEIRNRCEELLSLKVHGLVGDVHKLHGLNEKLSTQIADLQRDRNTTQILQMQKLLSLSSWTPEQHRQKLLNYTRRLYDDHNEEPNYQQMSTPTIESLRRDSVFSEWNRPGISNLLILRGVNNVNIREGKYHNWVSLFALDLVYRLQKNSSNACSPHAAYIFDPSPTADLASGSIFTAMPIVLLQLLWERQEELGRSSSSRSQSLMAALRRFHEHSQITDDHEKANEKAEVLGSLAEQVVHLYEKEDQPVYIVMDRVDKCSNHYALMGILVDKIMNKASCPVKILLVTDEPMGWPPLKEFGLGNRAQVQEVTWTQELLYQGY